MANTFWIKLDEIPFKPTKVSRLSNFHFEIYNYLKPHHNFMDTVYIKLMIIVDIQLVDSRWGWRVPSSRRRSRWPGSDDGSRDGVWTRRRQCCRAGEWEPSCPSCRGTDDAASSPWLRTSACSLLGATCDTPPLSLTCTEGLKGRESSEGLIIFLATGCHIFTDMVV